MSEDDDGPLVARWRAGDRAAFGQLVLRHQRPVYNVALRMLRNPEEARDVAQTAFLKAYEHAADFDPSYRFFSWIYRIAINEALHARDRRRPTGPIDADTVDEAPGPERLAEGERVRRALESAIAALTPEQQAVIVLRHVAQLSYEDMASALGVPEKTVKSRLYSARQLLRADLEARGALWS